MTFPSPEVARAVGTSKVFLEWMEGAKIKDFDTAWAHCHDGSIMYKVLLTLNPQFKNLHWVAMRAALRTVQAEDGDLDEKLLANLARKRVALEAGNEDYDSEAALSRALGLNRIITADDAPRAKGQANLAVAWACCRDARSCGMSLNAATGAERFRFLREQEVTDDTVIYQPQEPRAQANDIRELFPLPLTMSKIRYLNRYERPWVI
jgi:hypothetical protein